MELNVFPEKGFGSNAYLLISNGVGLLIDTGGHEEMILSFLKEKDIKLKTIIYTHGHVDHILGTSLLKEETGASLMIHREDGPMLTDSKKNLSFYLSGMGGDVEGPPADHLLEDGERQELEEIELKVLHTPGHTPGGIALLGDGILFSGDTLFAQGVGRTDFPGGSMETLMDSIKSKILTLDDSTCVYSGHGPESTVGRIKQENPFIL